MVRAVVVLLLVAAPAGAQENIGAAKGRVGAGALGGFDANFTLWESSGIVSGGEAYSNTLSLIVEPRFNIGRRWFAGRWAEPLAVSARILLAAELFGNDPAYRGSSFASPALLRDSPESVLVAQSVDPHATPEQIEGAARRLWVGDLWLSLTHGRVATIPKVLVDINAGARVVLPTSLESRLAGMAAAPSLAVGLSRKVWRLTFDYGFRAIKFFYTQTTGGIGRVDGTVDVNGQAVEPDHLAHTGVMNPDWGFVNFFGLGLELPRGFSVDAYYFLFNTLLQRPPPYRNPDGVPTDVDGDGAALGDLNRPGERDSQWFLIEADYRPTSWFTVGLGLSTFRPVRTPDGRPANPFFKYAPDNLTTVYLSLALNAEGLASAIKDRKK